MDTTSLILQIQSSGLSIDTKPLEAVLLSISETLKCHDEAAAKLPKVEQSQSDLRKELNKLKLALESIHAREDDEDVGATVYLANEVKGSQSTDTTSSELGVDNAAQNESSSGVTYGIRLDDSKASSTKACKRVVQC